MTPTLQRTVPLLVAMLLAALPATGQIRVIPEEKLLESSSPRLSSDSSALAFDRTKVLLDTLTEDSSPVVLEFRMTNTSKRKIALTRIATTCSCVEATAGRTVLPPGGTSTLTVR